MIKTTKSIILFDGCCNLCNATVKFVLKHDTKEQFLFASLQSDVAKEILLQFSIKKINLDTVILIEREKIYKKSTAAIKVLKHFRYYNLLYFLIYIPKAIRDCIYNLIAKNRYKWFGKKKDCILPSEEIKNRFLSS